MHTYKTITNSDAWTGYLKKASFYDAYHTLGYHTLDTTGEPVLFVYEEGEDFIALPLIKRAIAYTKLCDFTSSYGYSGPVSNKPIENLSYDLIENFKHSFLAFMEDNQAVSVFSRLNPFSNQFLLLEKLGGVKANGKTLYIKLKHSLEDQRSRYNRRLIRQIRQLRNRGYSVKFAETQEEITIFSKMYIENMKRVGAHPNYFFDEKYFSSLLKCSDFECKLMLIYDGNEIICGAIVIWVASVMRNHLSATKESHVHFSPSKLLTEEISLFGRSLGIEYFHLGGGVGGKEDSLFKFKSSFSNQLLEDKIWCFIADENAYNLLVKEKNIDVNRNFFPLYRS